MVGIDFILKGLALDLSEGLKKHFSSENFTFFLIHKAFLIAKNKKK